MWFQMMAEKGYIIWICDNRGASGKGEQSVWPSYKHFMVGELSDLEVRVEDLEVCRGLDVRRRDGTRALLGDVNLDLGRLAVKPADEALEVEDAVGHVLAHAGERRELVGDALDLDRGDRSALERREQHAAQRVAERVAEAAVERLDLEDATILVDLLVDDPRDLELH
jgi:hypothetical protein